jgi:hypothetical protein
LKELKVVLILSLHQLIYIDIALDVIFRESLLKYLVVFYILVVVLSIPLNLAHGDSARVASVNDLAIDCSRGALLNLGQLQVEEVIDPGEELSTTHEESAIHHSDSVCVCHF